MILQSGRGRPRLPVTNQQRVPVSFGDCVWKKEGERPRGGLVVCTSRVSGCRKYAAVFSSYFSGSIVDNYD